jgi:hypothetical protein
MIKRITTLNTFWQRVVHQRIGKDANVNPVRIIIAFEVFKSPLPIGNDCENVVMVFPSTNIANVTNGCEKMDNFLGKANFYTNTIN